MADLKTQIEISLLDRFSANLRKMGEGIGAVGGKLDEIKSKFQFAANIKHAADAAERFGQSMRRALEVPVRAAVAFDQQITQLQIIGKLSDDATSTLAENIKKISEATGMAKDAVAGVYGDLMAAFPADQVDKIANVALALSRVSGGALEPGKATEILSGTISGFGLKGSDAGQVGDILKAADDISKANATILGDFLARVGGTAASSGQSLQDASAAAAVLSERNVSAEQMTVASTAYNNILNRLSAPSASEKKALQEIGFRGKSLKDVTNQANSGDVFGAIKAIGDQLQKRGIDPTSTEGKSAIKGLLGGDAKAIEVFGDLSNAIKSGFLADKQRAIGGVAGKLDEAAAKIDATPAAKFAQMWQKSQNRVLEIGQKLLPVVLDLADAFMPVIDVIGGIIKDNPNLTKMLAVIAVVLTVFATVVGWLGNIAAAFTTTWAFLTPIFNAVIGAITIVAAALGMPAWLLGVIVAGVVALIATIVIYRKEIWNFITSVFDAIWNWGKKILRMFGVDIKDDPKPSYYKGVTKPPSYAAEFLYRDTQTSNAANQQKKDSETFYRDSHMSYSEKQTGLLEELIKVTKANKPKVTPGSYYSGSFGAPHN